MPYQMGVMTISRSGERHIIWIGEMPVIRYPKPRPLVLMDRKLETFRLQQNMDEIHWCLDECEHHDSYYRIRGFAFKRGNDHYRYEKKLILRNQNEEAWEFDMYPEERIDVAYSYPNEHFLFHTGYLCYVYDNVLQKENTYDVIIRLKNRFDYDDIRDIVTGKQICM